MKTALFLCVLIEGGVALALGGIGTAVAGQATRTFGEDAAFLRRHTGIILLGSAHEARVALAPAWQGRVMTSTAEGDLGRSFGWINRDLISAGKPASHINAFGGEDRLWLGPEGGQFSIFFAPGARFDYEHWFVPPALDTLPFKTVYQAKDRVSFGAEFSLTNFSGTLFHITIKRDVRLFNHRDAWNCLGLAPRAGVALVAYESVNTLVNAGTEPWAKETGLLSIWILGMFPPSLSATVVVPIKEGPDSTLGVKATSDYFGAVPSDRLKVRDGGVFLRADGAFRSKIGINPRRSLGRLGSYDAEHRVLTIVQFDQPEGIHDYVNSQWKLQDNPYQGDVENSYNDGPAAPGAKPLGPFYEVESSSPAAALQPGGHLEHTHRTFHLTGDERGLDAVARSVLGISLEQIDDVFHAD